MAADQLLATEQAYAVARNAKAMQRFAMYAGTGTHAQRPLHDTVAKVRLTGFATGRVISPVTKVEYEDENGNWKTL